MKIKLKQQNQDITIGLSDISEIKPLILRVMNADYTDWSQLNQSSKCIQYGLSELIINAIEHGALGLGSDKKYRLKRNGTYESYLNEKIRMMTNSILIECIESNTQIKVVIDDYGKGFDWKTALRIAETKQDGKGLCIAQNTFDELTFYENGSRCHAVCLKK